MNTTHSTDDTELPAIVRCQLPVSNHFPPMVRDALVEASRTSTDIDYMARVRAINHAVERAKLRFPNLFK